MLVRSAQRDTNGHMTTVTIDDISAARERIAPAAFETPLVRLPLDGEVYAKCENFQRTNSFKIRGAFNFLASLDAGARANGVVAHSSGNHAQGVAAAARHFGVPATIVIPEGAPEVKVERTKALGADVVRCENNSEARSRAALEIAERDGKTLVPPYDHPWIVAGQGTVGLEIADRLPNVANVLVCVGGGGLIAGIATALADRAPEATVLGVEPALAADAKESFESGSRTSWPAERVTKTIADGVRTQSIGELNFEIIQKHVDGFLTAEEDAIVEATRWYAHEAKLLVEPTGALTLAAWWRLAKGDLQGRRAALLRDGPTVLLVSGGNIAFDRLVDLIA